MASPRDRADGAPKRRSPPLRGWVVTVGMGGPPVRKGTAPGVLRGTDQPAWDAPSQPTVARHWRCAQVVEWDDRDSLPVHGAGRLLICPLLWGRGLGGLRLVPDVRLLCGPR